MHSKVSFLLDNQVEAPLPVNNTESDINTAKPSRLVKSNFFQMRAKRKRGGKNKKSGSSYLLVHLDVQPVRHFIVLGGKTKGANQGSNFFLLAQLERNRDSPSRSAAASPSSHWPVSHTPVSDCDGKTRRKHRVSAHTHTRDTQLVWCVKLWHCSYCCSYGPLARSGEQTPR